jgi:hypothetical protein
MKDLLHALGRALRTVLRPVVRLAGELAGLVPALFVGAGVFAVAAGLFSYMEPVAAQPIATASATPASSAALYTLPPLASGGASPGASAVTTAAIATRVVIPALGIDLPVVTSPPNEQFPLCNAAEYMVLGRVLAYPGLPQATYLYAHARKRMFLPLLTQSMVNNGSAMIGMWVEVYTDDNQRHVYEISKVIRHVPAAPSALDAAGSAKTDQLWLQTSEGPLESSTKLQIVATPIGEVAATQADAHPAAKGAVCPDAPICKTSDATGCRRR